MPTLDSRRDKRSFEALKTLRRWAYGFRHGALFILRMYSLHSTRQELVG